MTTIRTLGDGRFSVELRTSSEKFDPAKWQRDNCGEPLVGTLSLQTEGAQDLIEALADWQVGNKG